MCGSVRFSRRCWRMHATACNDSFLNWFNQTAPQLMHTTASCTLTPSMRGKSAYMESKAIYMETISNTLRASRKELATLNAECASLEVRRTALKEQIQNIMKEKGVWVTTNRTLQQDRKKCPHNRRPTRCFRVECKGTATECCRCADKRYQKSPRLRKACNCRCPGCLATQCSGSGVTYNRLVIPGLQVLP